MAVVWDRLWSVREAEVVDAAVWKEVAEVGVDDARELIPRVRTGVAQEYVPTVQILYAIALLNAPLAQAVLTAPGMLAALAEAATSETQLAALAHMLAGAASYAPLRTALGKEQVVTHWTATHTSQAKIHDEAVTQTVQASADLLAIKLAIHTGEEVRKGPLALSSEACLALLAALRAFLVNAPNEPRETALFPFHMPSAAWADALESVYYLVRFPDVRDAICEDPAFLRTLIGALGTERQPETPTVPSPHTFVLVSIFATIAAYASPKSAEQHRMEALHRSATKAAPTPPIRPEDAARRARAVVAAGAVPPLVMTALRVSSRDVRSVLADLFLALVTEQDAAGRGRLLQQGAGRAVMALCTDALTPDAAPAALLPVQALAKLTISTDPTLLYRMDGSMVLGIQCMAALFFAPHNTLLQLFEATMALTNLAGVSASTAHAVAHAKPVSNESGTTDIGASLLAVFLANESPMVRRALIELLCNLVQSPDVFATWAGEGSEAAPATDDPSLLRLNTPEGRLRLLVSLCAVESETDVAMAMAASGTLAALASSSAACRHLAAVPTESAGVLAMLLLPGVSLEADTAAQLALRGVTIAQELEAHADAASPTLAILLAACRAYSTKHAKPTSALQQETLRIARETLAHADKRRAITGGSAH